MRSLYRWSGRILGVFLAVLVAADILTDRFGYRGLLDFRRTNWVEQLLPFLVVIGALGLTYAWHREQTGANIALVSGLLYLGLCAYTLMPYSIWTLGAAVALAGFLLRLAHSAARAADLAEPRHENL